MMWCSTLGRSRLFKTGWWMTRTAGMLVLVLLVQWRSSPRGRTRGSPIRIEDWESALSRKSPSRSGYVSVAAAAFSVLFLADELACTYSSSSTIVLYILLCRIRRYSHTLVLLLSLPAACVHVHCTHALCKYDMICCPCRSVCVCCDAPIMIISYTTMYNTHAILGGLQYSTTTIESNAHLRRQECCRSIHEMIMILLLIVLAIGDHTNIIIYV